MPQSPRLPAKSKISLAVPVDAPSVTVNQDETAYTLVSIRVQWKSQTSNEILPADLCSLGKMMCRGTYAQIARAAWKNGKVREQLITLFLKEVDKECCNFCASKDPSILRLTDKKNILDFTKFEKELKERTPLLRSVLFTASVRRRYSSASDLYRIQAVCMVATACLKNRCPQMTAVQLLNTIFIHYSGLMVS